jgi:hypothetical protein
VTVSVTSQRLALLLTLLVALVVLLLVAAPRFGQAPATPAASPPRASEPADGATASPAGSAAASASPASLASSASATATTPDATAVAAAVLVGAGDIADCSSDRDEATADLLEGIAGTVFTLGDNAYENGTPGEFSSCYDPSWGRPSIRERTRPAAGNHDYNTTGAAGYFGYFGAAAGDPSDGWYAYDLGAWRIYVLNSNCEFIGGCAAGSSQERWLQADLARNPRACVAAMWHHPRFSSGRHGNDPLTEDLWKALDDAGAELVLVGHDHDYERFAPQTPQGAASLEGIVEIVVGTGGREPYAFERIRDNSLVRTTGTFGVLRLELSPDAYAFEFVSVAGQSFTDSGSGACD